MIPITNASSEPQSTLGPFLRMLRWRVPARSYTLGPSKRLPARRGRRVTQEEIAEAVGISRNWYRRLEHGDRARASTKLLVRIASALALTSDERLALFALAIPELRLTQVTDDSNAVVGSLARLNLFYEQSPTGLEAVSRAQLQNASS
jgi:transcriptional regulator with XRE-family HTH domain